MAHIASLFNEKASLFVKGRISIFDKLKESLSGERGVVWIHASSVGEFEQARPIIERIRGGSPNKKILLTFFSPSGYELRKNYQLVDWVFYLPFDFPKNSRRFIEIVNPSMAIFIKYDFWYYYLTALKRKNIPTYIVSAIFRKGQIFFKRCGAASYRELLECFTTIFVQNEESKDLLSTIGINRVEVVGDTRFDRVYKVAQEAKDVPLVEEFLNGKRSIVAGSTWREDELKLKSLLDGCDVSIVVAPHQVDQTRIKEVQTIFSDYAPVCYSKITAEGVRNGEYSASRVLIIDSLGILSSLYRYGDIAYIGGGFGAGIHNTPEAAVYGKGTLFGPNYRKFQEAKELIEIGCASSYTESDELIELVKIWFDSPGALDSISKKSKNYIAQKVGATDKIYNSLFPTL